MLLRIDPSQCTGCRLCVIYCSVKHRSKVDPARANIAVYANLEDHGRVPFTCFQCPDAACANACPTQAIERNEATGALVVRGELCVGCGACVEACPHGTIFLFPEDQVAQKCDLCEGAPECAAVCPFGAIRVADGRNSQGDIDEATRVAREALGRVPHRPPLP